MLSGKTTLMTNPLQLRQLDPDFLANFQKGIVELLGRNWADNLPPIFKLLVAVALTDNAVEILYQRSGIPADE